LNHLKTANMMNLGLSAQTLCSRKTPNWISKQKAFRKIWCNGSSWESFLSHWWKRRGEISFPKFYECPPTARHPGDLHYFCVGSANNS
jgi:hypothetical protein